jgi:hypothetical protein
MKHVSLMRNVGLLMAFSAVLFVGCKKETVAGDSKEQNGPSLTVAGDSGVVIGDQTLPSRTHLLRFKLIAQKGSGKDDADLKEYTITGTNNIVNVRYPAPNEQSFVIDTTMRIAGANNQSYTITFTVIDKNDKSASRRFTIRFFRPVVRDPVQHILDPSAWYVDSLLNAFYTNQSDNKGTHLRYQVSTGMFTLQNRTQANGNPSEILFIYWYSSIYGWHSVVSPAILRDPMYDGTTLEWDNPSTLVTNFREAPSSVNFATAGYEDIINAYNNGAPINNEFPNNADQRARCTTGRILAFKQGNIYGLIRVESVTSGGPGATLSVKVARP